MSSKRTAGRLEGTYAFLGNDAPEPGSEDWLLHEIYVAGKEHGQMFAESFQPSEMVKPTSGKAAAGAER